MSDVIKKVEFYNTFSVPSSSSKKNNLTSSISTIDGTVYDEFDDGSWQWTEDYNGRKTTFHEYSDGTKTLDYVGNHGKRIIDTVDSKWNLLNRRFFGDNAEKYTVYGNGEKKETELFKIYDMDKNIDFSTKKSIGTNEWLASGKFRKQDAQYHHYSDGSITIDYILDNDRYIYTYDKDGVLQNKRVITDDSEVLFEYDNLGNIANTNKTIINNPVKNNETKNDKVGDSKTEDIKIKKEKLEKKDPIIQDIEREKNEVEEIQKEDYYKYPSYQKKLERAIEDYNQGDGIVANEIFFSNGYSFSSLGCGVASLMYIHAMQTDDFDFDPIEFTNDAISQGYFTDGGSNSYMLLDEKLNSAEDNILKKKWGLEATEIDSNENSIISALEDGKKIVFNVRPNEGFYVTSCGHYIVLDHYDKDTNQIYVFDPAARPGFRSTDRMGYQDVEFLKEELFNIPNNPPLAIESNKGKGSAE